MISGVCRVCACTAKAPCLIDVGETNLDVQPCAWMDREQTLCSNPRCLGTIPLAELIEICFPSGRIATGRKAVHV